MSDLVENPEDRFSWFMTIFLLHSLRKICNVAVTDIPLNQYKRNWSIACDLSESLLVLSVAFLFLSGICSENKSVCSASEAGWRLKLALEISSYMYYEM